MTVVPMKYWWVIQATYLACGFLLGLADPLLGQGARGLGVKPGVATAVSVNLLLPLAALVLALLTLDWQRWLGAAVMTAGITTGLAVRIARTGRSPVW